jgi:hypothetical protein
MNDRRMVWNIDGEREDAMKTVVPLVLIGLSAAVFLGYPLLGEDTGSECDAFERLAVRLSLSADAQKPPTSELALGQFLQGFSKGQFARAAASDRYPNVPVSVACAILYWRTVADPRSVRQILIGRR